MTMEHLVQARYRPCPICGGTSCRPLHEMGFVLPQSSPLPAAYAIVASTDCGFVYADTPGTGADYARYYAEFSHYEDPAIATGSGEQEFDRERLAETADWLAGHIPADAHVLDVGCGNGGLLLALRARGFTRLTGLDPAQACVARLRAQGMEAYLGWVGDDLPQQPRFDLILLSHVLEHLFEPRLALTSLHRLLTPHGKVYVETPDAARYADFPSVPWYYFDSEHINHFDRASLDNLARASGFRTVHAAAKTLTVQGGHHYPAVFALLSPASAPAPLLPDDTARQAITRYIAQSTQTGLAPALLLAIEHWRPIALWGAGSQAQRLMQSSAMHAANLVAVVDGDRNKHGQNFAGCVIASPATGLRDLPSDTLVVIAAALVAEQIRTAYYALGLPYECIIN